MRNVLWGHRGDLGSNNKPLHGERWTLGMYFVWLIDRYCEVGTVVHYYQNQCLASLVVVMAMMSRDSGAGFSLTRPSIFHTM